MEQHSYPHLLAALDELGDTNVQRATRLNKSLRQFARYQRDLRRGKLNIPSDVLAQVPSLLLALNRDVDPLRENAN